VYRLPDDLRELYAGLGIDPAATNGIPDGREGNCPSLPASWSKAAARARAWTPTRTTPSDRNPGATLYVLKTLSSEE
jgi:hypothetical protein